MEKIAVNIVICSVTMTAAGLLYMLILRLLRSVQSAKWRYYSWILIFLGFLLPVKPWSAKVEVSLTTDSSVAIVQVDDMAYSVDTYSPVIDIHLIFQAVFAVWASGTVICLMTAVIRQLLFNRSVRRLSAPVPHHVNMIISDIADELVIWQRVKAVTLKGISSPMTTGFLKPTIILPDTGFSDGSLKMILEHELVHFKRRDVFIKAFMVLVSSIHWFNPLVRLFIKRAERECELYCDETVMSGKTDEEKRLYCKAILDSARAGSGRNGFELKPAVSSGFFSGKAGMKRRMEKILSGRKMYRFGLVCTAAAVMLTVYAGSVFSFSRNGEGPFDYGFYATTTAVSTWPYSIIEESTVSTTFGMTIGDTVSASTAVGSLIESPTVMETAVTESVVTEAVVMATLDADDDGDIG